MLACTGSMCPKICMLKDTSAVAMAAMQHIVNPGNVMMLWFLGMGIFILGIILMHKIRPYDIDGSLTGLGKILNNIK